MKGKDENIIVEKSYAFSVRCVKLYKYLSEKEHDYVICKQLLRSGTSIGANIKEAIRGYSKADFASKVGIALKEASETEYWIELLHESGYINDMQFDSIYKDIGLLIGTLIKIIKTAKQTS